MQPCLSENKQTNKHLHATYLQHLLTVEYQYSVTSMHCMSTYRTFSQMLCMSHSAPECNLTMPTTILFEYPSFENMQVFLKCQQWATIGGGISVIKTLDIGLLSGRL